MGSKTDKGIRDAREYIHAAAIGVDRKRKKALLGRPTTPVEVKPDTTVSELLDSYRDASFQARALGNCAAVFDAMLRDKDRPTIFLGMAGSLIAAGMRRVITDLIEKNMVDVVVSTGAIISQDLYQVRGGRHYHGSVNADDKELRDLYIDRLYDTFIDEEKYWKTDLAVSQFADGLAGRTLSSRAFLALLAESAKDDPGSILGACARNGVPLFVPALNDSSIGIGLTEHYHRMRKAGRQPMTISSIRDNYELTQIVVKSPATAAVYVSGGPFRPRYGWQDRPRRLWSYPSICGHSTVRSWPISIGRDRGRSDATCRLRCKLPELSALNPFAQVDATDSDADRPRHVGRTIVDLRGVARSDQFAFRYRMILRRTSASGCL